jgi:drug/metabolite transporter (DMT)-like permease
MARVAPTQQYHAPSHIDRVKVASSLIALVGAYMLLSAWRRDLDIGNQLNAIIAGAVACALGVAINRDAPGYWASWFVALIGVWFIGSPWVYRYVGDAWTWHSLGAGFVLLVLGIWCARNAPARHHGIIVRRRRSPSGHS